MGVGGDVMGVGVYIYPYPNFFQTISKANNSQQTFVPNIGLQTIDRPEHDFRCFQTTVGVRLRGIIDNSHFMRVIRANNPHFMRVGEYYGVYEG